jgi:cysteine synthase A
MPKIYKSVAELVGNTPLFEPTIIEKELNLLANLYLKLEYFNPAGSIKDRAAKQMILDAEQSGELRKGGTIIEATSGNTGIGLAAIGASRGYKVIIVMPDSMSEERIKLMKLYGAEVVLTPGTEGMSGSIRKAEDLASEIPGSFIPSQFDNPANPLSHYKTTGPEIWEATEGNIDILVAGIGTGGTLSGTGKYLKEQKSDIKVIGAEPEGSPLLTKGVSGKHGIQGMGANFIPENLDRSIYDEIIDVPDECAFQWALSMAKQEGVAVGISSGAALYTAVKVAQRPENEGKTIVVIMTDTGERYLSAFEL